MLIIDMIMPGMSGGQAYDEMKDADPDAKVILSSGYSIEGQATEIMGRGCNKKKKKPFSMKELSKRIRDVLDKCGKKLPDGESHMAADSGDVSKRGTYGQGTNPRG
ncbi:MAG: response regulator [Deltaproteobacteria bacterium]|nr:response regulator [Deltaproteobacteria bacterium]